MTKIININRNKESKKYKKIYDDLRSIKQILTLTKKALDYFPDYAIVKNMSNFTNGQMVVLDAHIKKYEGLINEDT